jgi:hypothetical protein
MINQKPKKIPVCARRKKHIHRNCRITIYAEPDQKEAIIMEARKARLTVSAWLLEKAGV